VDGETHRVAACILNKLRGKLQVAAVVAAVRAPGSGDNCKSILGDLSILTGGTVFSSLDTLDIKIERTTVDLLGSTGSVTITKEFPAPQPASLTAPSSGNLSRNFLVVWH
jgi:chaperonin GroEL